ncbi:cation-translocating P-type ATPase C-terminal domain-containing protein [Streptomyces sp. NPDC004609]|uniref:cation-translocating P-type ATPase C-terminal domain-containing protein n=1 Tax=Streptomyces sp. NPDC004609 TaxID=3364704 RepID=UPI00367D7A9E
MERPPGGIRYGHGGSWGVVSPEAEGRPPKRVAVCQSNGRRAFDARCDPVICGDISPSRRGAAGRLGAVILLGLIKLGEARFGSVEAGSSMAFTAFALCLIVAAFECRSETASVVTTGTFDSRQMNRAALSEFVLAVLVTQMDAFRRVLGTTRIDLRQFGWALLSALVLLVVWELAKFLARRAAAGEETRPDGSGTGTAVGAAEGHRRYGHGRRRSGGRGRHPGRNRGGQGRRRRRRGGPYPYPYPSRNARRHTVHQPPGLLPHQRAALAWKVRPGHAWTGAAE